MCKSEDACAVEKRAAHGVHRVGHGIQAGDDLQPRRQNAYREEHAAGDAGNSEDEPLRGIPPLEQQQIRRREDTETGKGQQRGEKHGKNGQPVCGVQGKIEQHRRPAEIDGDAQGGGSEGIKCRADEDDRQGNLRDQQRFERAGVAGVLQAAVKRIQGGVQVVEENESGQRVGEIRFALGKGFAKRRRIHEPRHIVKHAPHRRALLWLPG